MSCQHKAKGQLECSFRGSLCMPFHFSTLRGRIADSLPMTKLM